MASSHNGQLRFALQEPIVELPESTLALSGKHNVQNALAVGCAAQALGVKPEIIRDSLETFTNVPHRLEYIASIDGVDYINAVSYTHLDVYKRQSPKSLASLLASALRVVYGIG